MKRNKMFVAATAMFAASLATAPSARADFLEEAGWGSLTVLSNLGYMPAKILYSSLGG